ncbi:MAG TPA: 23S rRNA (guanosine(2251)-2'-O)-methyltransferase RlmB [Thermodesulfatator sp.]|nr:23S rRNA (guanosine(2251)-2'-O)-methyltransferase RlmB [Thermodesulfatator sp.]
MAEVIWGYHPVLEALSARPGEVERIVVSQRHLRRHREIINRARRLGIPLEIRAQLPPLKAPHGGKVVHQGVVAYVATYRYATLEEIRNAWQKAEEPAFVLLLDQITDPQNLGALIRSAEAAGVQGVIIPKHRSARVTATVEKASAGATEHVLVARVTNLVRTMEWLKGEGLWLVGAAPEGEKILYDLDLRGPVGIVVGSEGRGLRPLVAQSCDFLARIPMRGRLSSLNASVAGALFLFEVVRQRLAEERC